MAHVSVDISRRNGTPDAVGCPSCKELLNRAELAKNLQVCHHCGHHFRVGARERVGQLADVGTWSEIAGSLRSADPLEFYDLRPYPERIEEAEYDTGLSEAILVGTCKLHKMDVVLAAMDFAFLGGSMGSVVGERFWRAAETAAESRFPLVVVCASGGARMQEGILSLMQMAKTTCAVEMLGEVPVPFVTVLTHPTTGGVMASFATLADVIISEPGALLCFTGPRVIEQTVKEALPEDFGRAESNLAHGQIDMIVSRPELKDRLVQILGMMEGGVACALEPIWEAEARRGRRGGPFAEALKRIKALANPSGRPSKR
ncbi:MAG: acetyl-CoA carboxylase carboxyltransferase subunit beta [Thermoleophilia bacterium]|nr:acetyl-CoA carboxylase carboxyltransferase subunit beta [Thermoleophilia bacterium]